MMVYRKILDTEWAFVFAFFDVFLFLLILFGVFGGAASAQTVQVAPTSAATIPPNNASEPLASTVMTRFEDWELACGAASAVDAAAAPPGGAKTPTAAPHASCKVMQRLVTKDGGQTVFLISVLSAAKPGELVTIISVPLGGYLVPGMELHVDKAKPVRVLFETCNSGGCHGGFALTGRIRDALMAAKSVQVRVWTTKSKPVDVAVSFNGFAKAVKALQETTK